VTNVVGSMDEFQSPVISTGLVLGSEIYTVKVWDNERDCGDTR